MFFCVPLTSLCLLFAPVATDGDTIRDGALRVRLWGIDAPELKTEAGPASRTALAEMIAGRVLVCQHRETDVYRRSVSTCAPLWGGADLACAMVAAGQAADWPKYSRGFYAACASAPEAATS